MPRGKGKLPAGMSIRKDGRYMLKFQVDGERYSVYGNSVPECRERELEKREKLKNGLMVSNENITLDQYYKAWQAGRVGTIKKSTRYAQDRQYKQIKKIMGRKKLVKIERRDVIALQKELSDTLTTQGVNLAVSLLKSILRAAVNDRIISWNPCEGVRSLKRTEPKATDTIHRALTEEEQKTFFQYAPASWYCNFYKFLLLTGVRTGEAAALQWSDIDYKAELIHITKTVARISNDEYAINEPKTKTSKRDIPLTEDIKAVLQDQRQQQRDVFGAKIVGFHSRVFTATDGKDFVKTSNIRTSILNILNKAERDGQVIEPFSPHCFRDTFATRAIESGMEPQTLKTILGHASLSMTMDLYAHVMPNTKKMEMDKVKIVI